MCMITGVFLCSSGLVPTAAQLSPEQTFGSIRSLAVSREVASFPLSRTPTPPPVPDHRWPNYCYGCISATHVSLIAVDYMFNVTHTHTPLLIPPRYLSHSISHLSVTLITDLRFSHTDLPFIHLYDHIGQMTFIIKLLVKSSIRIN